MHSLPSELQSLIIGQLHKPDYLEYITVCKAWYTIFMPFIYESIIIKDNGFMITFLESMMTRPRCIDACQYIQEIDATHLPERLMTNQVTNGDENDTNHIDFMDLLINCRNLKVLHINAKKDMIGGLMHDTPKHLLKLQNLKFYGVTEANANSVLFCLIRYKSSLTSLELDYTSFALKCYTMDKTVTLLSLFKSLKTLVIQSPPKAREGFNLLDIIFQGCPNLITLSYQDKKKVLMDVTPRTHSLKEMHIGSKDIYLQDIFHLKNRFSHLSKLVISIQRKVDLEAEFINTLMSMKHLITLNLSIAVVPEHQMKDALVTFWKHAPDITPEGVYGHTAKVLSKKDRIMMMQLNFSYNAQYNERVLDTNIQMEDATYVADVLEEIGSSLHVLQIEHSCKMSISLSHLNSLCPYLVKLQFSVYYSNFNNQPHHLQNNLKELHLCYCPLKDKLMRAIEHLYPQLEFLRLTVTNFDFGPGIRRVLLHLPNTLKRFMLGHTPYFFEETHFLLRSQRANGKFSMHHMFSSNADLFKSILGAGKRGMPEKRCLFFMSSTDTKLEIGSYDPDLNSSRTIPEFHVN